MLKSLELFGFKSFAERTLFEFAPGITCVVGPNGSGKSNVVDSIKWILGDQSPKSLRGKEMADVIFNGSSGRKPSPSAEAVLTFDNAHRVLPIDMPLVQIGRRLYRSGDSEYLLNGAAVRLKDVRELLLGTGAGTAAYSIIEQGRVDQILQSNPASRRQVFEEAAGVSRYRMKRVDAERRLERVTQNLQRLTDIVDEIEKQLNATRSQASKAARHRELSRALQELWMGLAADDDRCLTTEQRLLDAELTNSRSAALQLQARLAELSEERHGVEAELGRCEESLRGIGQEAAGYRQSLAAESSTARHNTKRSEELASEIDELRRRQRALAAEAELADRELQDVSVRLEQLAASLNQRRRGLEERQTIALEVERRLSTAREDVRRRRNECAQARRTVAEASEQLAVLSSQQTAAAEQCEDLERRRGLADEQAAAAAIALQESLRELEAVDADSLAARAALEARLQERTKLSREAAALEQRLNEAREQRTTWHARLLLLHDWEERSGGLGVGVRELLARAGQSAEPPWTGVRGVVCELLESSLEHAPLIDLILGERARAIVVDDLAVWLEHLQRRTLGVSGRLGFVGLPTASSSSPAAPLPIAGRPGVVSRADLLVKEFEAAPGLAAHLLGDCWIVQNLAAAVRLAAEFPGQAAFATLQGELIDRGGQLIMGVSPGESAVVSRRSELRQLTLDLRRLDRQLDTDTARLVELTAAATSRDAAVQFAEAGLRRLLEASTSARARAEVHSAESQRRTADAQQLAAQHEEALRRRDDVQRRRESLRQEQQRLSAEADHLEGSAAGGEAEIQAVAEELQLLQRELDAEQLDLAKQDERQAALHETLDRFQRDQSARRRQEQDARRRREQAEQQATQTLRERLAGSAAIAGLASCIERCESGLRRLEATRIEIRSRRQALLEQEEAARRRRREHDDRIHHIELRLRELAHQRGALEARMQEDYQTSLDQVTASGVSAYAAYLQNAAQGGRAASLADEEDAAGSDPPQAHAPHDDPPPPAAVRPAPYELRESSWDEAGFREIRPELEAAVERLRRRLKALGHVNPEALQDLDDLERRHTELNGQLHDLQEARTVLEDIIRRINQESRRLFLGAFETIRGHFRELFRKLFGGGEADIVLENPEDVLECGIDIVARPPGKELRSLSLLSGGEKTLTAVAMLFAMFKSKPSPYCILDEVDAALDEANVERYAAIVRDFVSMTQFIIITHRKRTMTAADVLYGVTMEQAGISKRMAVRFEDVGEHGEIRGGSKSRAA